MSSLLQSLKDNLSNNRATYTAMILGGLGNAYHNKDKIPALEAVIKGAFIGLGVWHFLKASVGGGGSSSKQTDSEKNSDEIISDIHSKLSDVELKVGSEETFRPGNLQLVERVNRLANGVLEFREIQNIMFKYIDKQFKQQGLGQVFWTLAKNEFESAKNSAPQQEQPSQQPQPVPEPVPVPQPVSEPQPVPQPTPKPGTSASTEVPSSTRRRSSHHPRRRDRSRSESASSSSCSSRSPSPRRHHHRHKSHHSSHHHRHRS